ncbi:hypothetical protein DQ04_02161040 [Trypanosoma grayi]|uniref:hypothetical protein n=1 Tax=Trypanosoma grayi TaxID=71804 RepID=UPI0004F48EB3|nr:hypothetical protein DQ04_02161040 [Trypanosoma grayi]KEG11910.1 hypothetical protein DQ04_02161040 [Trypanosoma grayi]
MSVLWRCRPPSQAGNGENPALMRRSGPAKADPKGVPSLSFLWLTAREMTAPRVLNAFRLRLSGSRPGAPTGSRTPSLKPNIAHPTFYHKALASLWRNFRFQKSWAHWKNPPQPNAATARADGP